MKYTKQEKILLFIESFIILIAGIYNIGKLGNPYFTPDETGYWAAGAWMRGIDWSPVFSHSAYYGWGYGLILSPFFVVKNSVLRFQCAVLLNAIFLVVSFFLLVQVCEQLFDTVEKKKIILAAGLTVLFPYNIVYAHLTMCEVFLMMCFLISVKAFLIFCRNQSEIAMVVFVLSLFLQLATHLRTLAFLIAASIAILFMMVTKKISIRNIILFVSGIVIIWVIVNYVKENLLLGQYTSDIGTIRHKGNESVASGLKIFTYYSVAETVEALIYSIIGKSYYLIAGSFFFVLWGFKYLLGNVWDSLKKAVRRENTQCQWKVYTLWYIFFSFLGAFGIDCIAMMFTGRIDNLFYGRYVENTVSILICIGIIKVLEKRISWIEVSFWSAYLLAGALILYNRIQNLEISVALPLQSSGLAIFFPKNNRQYANLFTFYAVLVVILLSFIFYYFVKKNEKIAFAIISLVWCIGSYNTLTSNVYPEIKRMNYIIEAIEEVKAYDRDIYTLIPEDRNRYVAAWVDACWMQFQLGEQTLDVVEEKNLQELKEKQLLIISKAYPNAEKIVQNCNFMWENERVYIVESR